MTNHRTPRPAARRLAIGAGLAVALVAGMFGAATAASRVPETVSAAAPASGPAKKAAKKQWLFVQTAGSGTWKTSGDGTVELTMSGVAPRVLAFTDRPSRDVAQPLIVDLFPTLGFEGDDPPNAALVVASGGKERNVVVELTGYRYDRAARTVTYTARLIDDADQRRITAENTGAAKVDSPMPARLTQPVLLIDWGLLCGGPNWPPCPSWYYSAMPTALPTHPGGSATAGPEVLPPPVSTAGAPSPRL